MSHDLVNLFDVIEPNLEENWSLCELQHPLRRSDWLLLLQVLGEEDIDFSVPAYSVDEQGFYRAKLYLSAEAMKAYETFNHSISTAIWHQAADFSTSCLTG